MIFVCKECGQDSKKWSGKCLSCGAWNSMTEMKETREIKDKKKLISHSSVETKPLREFTAKNEDRIKTMIPEFDEALSGGFVIGSVTLLSGEPGIGKSTLLLQVAHNISIDLKILYISGEESGEQIAKRAKRMNIDIAKDVYFSNETCVENILNIAKENGVSFLIIDSIQTVFSQTIDGACGSVSQIRNSTALITTFAKQNNITTIIIGHINKDGQIAGPKILEHIIDTALLFEKNTENDIRMIKVTKNRFGSINETGMFEMTEAGLKSISNPSEFFISKDSYSKILFASASQKRSIVYEIEALSIKSFLPMPRRVSIGWDSGRLAILLALLQKHGMNFFQHDVYTSVLSGFSIEETTADLAFAAAIIKSSEVKNIPTICCIGEVALSGKIKGFNRIEDRIKEAKKFGVNYFFIPHGANIKNHSDVKIIEIEHIKYLKNELEKISR